MTFAYVGSYTSDKRHGRGRGIEVYRVDDASGRLTVIGRQSTGGTNGVHLAVDASNRFLVVGNYASGTVAVLPIAADGSLGPLTDLVTLTGTPGPDPVHPAGTSLYVANQGSDTIVAFRADPATGALTPTGQVIPTASPSSIVFS